jgi:hypothetical protein
MITVLVIYAAVPQLRAEGPHIGHNFFHGKRRFISIRFYKNPITANAIFRRRQ